jgi:dihydrofolate reductase
MRKIILSVAVSLDGYIEGPNGEYDWCPPPSKDEMSAFMNRVDTVFMGRKSYEMMGKSMFPGMECFIFSNTLKEVKGKDMYLMKGDIVTKVKDLKIQKGKDIWLFGGASLTTTFLNEGLIDEMWLGLTPIVLGAGKPLFQNLRQRSTFDIISSAVNGGYVSLGLRYNKQNLKPNKKKVGSLAEK